MGKKTKKEAVSKDIDSLFFYFQFSRWVYAQLEWINKVLVI